jgi:multidrug resistance efflux pump
MNIKTTRLFIFLALSALLLQACGAIGGQQAGAATPTPLPVVVAETNVVAEGRVVPNQFVSLSFKTGGQVAEVLVKEGETVEAGEAIARLDDSEQLASAVAGAEVELLNAQQALKSLDENAPVTAAMAEEAVTDSRDAVREAERYLNSLKTGSRQTDLDTAEADVILLKDRLDKAQEEFDRHDNNKDDSVARATFLSKLADAQEQYNNAVRLLNNLQGTPSELDMAIAEANLAVAQAQLALNEQKYEEAKNGIDPDDLAAAQARVKAAEAGQAAAQAALDNVSVVAPFSGAVADLQLKVGEMVSPGQAVVTLADFSKWVVETDDLTEIEVPRIGVGQKVTVTADALPDLELTGEVESISDVFEEKRGDIVYTARVVLDEVDERLRWGMTTVVTFEK